MNTNYRNVLATIVLIGLAQPASADVITDWNDRAVAYVLGRGMGPPPAERVVAMTHVAMFDALNSIERRYQPYLVQLPAAAAASKEAASASAAGHVLAGIRAQTQAEMKAALSSYLAGIPDGPAKAEGIRLGEAVAAKVLDARANDGSAGPDSYRPKAKAGVYVPTAATWAPQWPNVKPFAMTGPSQFRPTAPIALTSKEWAADYSEIVRGIYEGKKLGLLDGARFYALTAVARADAMIAVFEAKYHYDFWRPVTAIRNGDIDDNPVTERDTMWQPLGETPMHPDYPCAHCILAASMTGVVETLFGTADVPEVSTNSPTLPGVTHRWTNMRALDTEVSEARIWAGFHYRFSTRVAQDMGRKLGGYVANSLMQPAAPATR